MAGCEHHGDGEQAPGDGVNRPHVGAMSCTSFVHIGPSPTAALDTCTGVSQPRCTATQASPVARSEAIVGQFVASFFIVGTF